MVGRKISLVITTWNRDQMTVNAFRNVIDDERISEVVIVDDKSEPQFLSKLKELCTHPKIKLFVNAQNLGCYRNKKEAISKSSEEFVIILDSDNTIDNGYIDAIFSTEWNARIILAPDYARPHFNYCAFSGVEITRENIKQFLPTASKTRFDCLINCMNYFVNRDEYLRVWDGSIEPWTADTIYQNYRWLQAGNTIKVVKGMQYDHLIHNGSHYQNFNKYTGNFYKEVENKMMRL